jgi:NTP pyrophosphatase (non-canonical NTP hydrolase)
MAIRRTRRARKPNKLTFDKLRSANLRRLSQFKNSLGEPAHGKADGSDWDRAAWLEAVVGEIGEYANFSKKFRRGDISYNEFMLNARKELADVQIYLDLLAYQLGIDLGAATRAKFNETSAKIGVKVKL